MQKRLGSPTRAGRSSRSPIRQSPVKGGTYDSELMRVLRERDEMQAMLEKYERHLSEIQANLKVLTADRDNTSMQYLQAQEEIAQLRRELIRSTRSSKSSVTAQAILKQVETERDAAAADLRRMTTERDSLRERLRISQDGAINDRAHLEQRIEELQNTVLMLEEERAEQKNRVAVMRETVKNLEVDVQTLNSKMAVCEEELNRSRTECNILRLSNGQMEKTLTDIQRRLTFKTGELQSSQQKNMQLTERSDSLQHQVQRLKEEVNSLQSSTTNLQQSGEALQDEVQRKTNMLVVVNQQLDEKEKTIRTLKLSLADLDMSLRSLRETHSSREQELGVTRKKLADVATELTFSEKGKETALRENVQLRKDLEKAHIQNQELQLKLESSIHDVEDLRMNVQNYVIDISRVQNQLSSKERECRDLQDSKQHTSAEAETWEEHAREAEATASNLRLELIDSEKERSRLQDKVVSLAAALQEAESAERHASHQLSQLNRTLLRVQDELQQSQSQRTALESDLEQTRVLCIRLDARKEAVLKELDSQSLEMDRLRKQLSSERLSSNSLEAMLVSSREVELHRQLSAQERQVELQLLKDKLNAADRKASTQSRELAKLQTRSTQLETDLENTKRQLGEERIEREHAVQELRLQGLCSTPRRSLSPNRSFNPLSEHSYLSSPERLLPERPSERNVSFKFD